MIYLFQARMRNFRFNQILVFLALFLISGSLNAAVIPLTSPVNANQTWNPGDVIILQRSTPPQTNFVFNGSVTATGGNITIQVDSGLTVQFSNTVGQVINIGNMSSPSTWTINGSGTWNGVQFSGTMTRSLRNITFSNIAAAQTGLTLLTAGSPLIRGCTITGVTFGMHSSNSNPVIVGNTFGGSTASLRVSDTTSGVGALPRISQNKFNGTGFGIQFFSNVTRTLYAENNYMSGGVTTQGLGVGTVLVDASPDLSVDPSTSPAIQGINAGTYDGPNVYLYGNAVYRLMGDVSVANGSTLSLGGDIETLATVGTSILELNDATVDLTINTGGTLSSVGLNAARNQFRAPTPGGAGTRGNITLNTGSTGTFQFTDVRDGIANIVNGTATLTSTSSRFFNNTTGLQFNGTTAPTITNSDINSNTTNLSYTTVGPVLTIPGIYWGAATPNTALFSGAGAIDFEPWRTGSLGTGSLTSQAPATPNAFNPTDNVIIAGSVTQLQMTSTDIGFYNNGTLGRMTFGIEIATDPAFTAVVERANPAGAPPLGASLNVGTFDAGTYANSVTATYTINSVLAPGTYYWRAAAYDPLGSVSYGNFGGSFANSTATRNTFIIGAPSLSITMNAINFTKGQNPAINADAGDYIDYVVTYANTGTQPANNAQITNVLPTDTQFANNVIYNISSSTTVTVNVHSTFAGGSIIGQDINAIAPAATNVAVAWNTMALAVPANVLRIEFYFGTIPAGGSGTLTYRVRVK